jgi:crotonobetainyl-CoA:carnitine CoA-transferase CaiB-like acyl-CoA transferase
MTSRPLEGVRVVDFTWVRAGPWATRWLALLGADVIKVEWPDPAIGGSTGRVVRNIPGMGTTPDGVPRTMNSDGHFNDMHAMKRSVTLNARSPRGLELVKRLVSMSDVVIENFSAGVLSSWGLGFEEMQKLKKDIIYVSMAGFGHTGPRAHFQTMGPSVQALSGLTYISGLPETQPAGWGWSYMDDTGGMYGIMGVLTALQHRQNTGEGQHVDLSQVAAAMTLLGPVILDKTVNGRGARREGYPPGDRSVWPGTPTVDSYRGPIGVPHNSYRTRGGGHNDWAVITCETDQQWANLVGVLGSPAWATDPALATLEGRIAAQEAIDQHLQTWAQDLDKYDLMDRCQSAGVPAMAVQSSEDRVEHDPQLRARGMYDPVSHPLLGSWPMQHAPWQMSETPTPIDHGAPLCGEHNIEILCGMLGVSPEELRSGYEDNTFWPKSVALEPYLMEALESQTVS